MPEIIKIPQRKVITKLEQPQQQLPVDYKIVSEPNYMYELAEEGWEEFV